MAEQTIEELEKEIAQLTEQLRQLREQQPGTQIKNYQFDTLEGKVTLRDLFAGKDKLLAIHNMGQACRYCTLWGDGLNPYVEHLETAMSVVLLSKDSPRVQRTFANARNWRMRMASHAGGEYMQQQVAADGMDNMPGAVVYELKEGTIYRKASTWFGPGDLYCSVWHFLGLAGIALNQWTPQYNYWQRPSVMEDGGENLLV
ncbi:MAG: DUF899 family protein [Granulosicoccus sp.]|nr:DUF899 family protein [Granulosicoccus sp.]